MRDHVKAVAQTVRAAGREIAAATAPVSPQAAELVAGTTDTAATTAEGVADLLP